LPIKCNILVESVEMPDEKPMSISNIANQNPTNGFTGVVVSIVVLSQETRTKTRARGKSSFFTGTPPRT